MGEEIEGRRIYIGRNTIRRNIRSRRDAYAHSYGLAATRGARIMDHRLDDAINLGDMRPKVAVQILGSLVTSRSGTMGELLKRTGYEPILPRHDSTILPILNTDEDIVATCYDSGLYTFATGDAAAERMWLDGEDVDSLLDRMNTRIEDLPDDIRDLTVMSGVDDLFPISTNMDGTYSRLPDNRNIDPISRRGAQLIDDETRQSYLRYVSGVCLNVYHGLLDEGDSYSPVEMDVLSGVLRACEVSFNEFSSY